MGDTTPMPVTTTRRGCSSSCAWVRARACVCTWRCSTVIGSTGACSSQQAGATHKLTPAATLLLLALDSSLEPAALLLSRAHSAADGANPCVRVSCVARMFCVCVRIITRGSIWGSGAKNKTLLTPLKAYSNARHM